MEALLPLYPPKQDEIPKHPKTGKCHLVYMIEKGYPFSMINRIMSLYTENAITSFRDKDGKSLIYHAIDKQNIELTRDLIVLYKSEAFYETMSDGTYLY